MALPFSDLARFVGMEPDEAQDALHRLIDDIRTALASEGQCDVEGVGRFVRRNGTVTFQADPYLSTLVNGPFAGLDPVALPDYQALSTPELPAEIADPDAFPGFDAGEAEWGDERVPWAIEPDDTPAAPEPPQAQQPPAPPAEAPPAPPQPEAPASAFESPASHVLADPFADSDLFTDIWDEPGPPEDEHPLGPSSSPRFEEADFNVVADPAPDDVPPPRTRKEAASHADDLFSWFQRNPDEARAADALLLAARRYEEAGMMQEAGQLFSEFVKRFPDHPQTNAARRSLGWMEVGPETPQSPQDTPPAPPPFVSPPVQEPPVQEPPVQVPPRERPPLTLVTPPAPPPPPTTNTTFQEWSPQDLDPEPPAPPAPPPPPPPAEAPPVADAPPRFEMGPPDNNLPLPPPPRRHSNLSVPTTVIEARRKARRDQDRKRTQMGVIIVAAVLLFALALAVWYQFLRPGTTPTPPVANTPEQVEPLPEDPPVTDPDVAPAEPVETFDPFRSADPIDPLAGGWMWVMGSYPTQASADEAAETYRAQGFRTGAVPGLANGRRVFRVGIGQFESAEAAQAVESELPETVAPGRPWLRQIGT